MPLVVAFMAICFNLVNGFLNGYYFSAFSRVYTWDWLLDLRFILGAVVFGVGVLLNWWSDQILLNLRKGGKKGYFIPEGGLFRWISCPNFCPTHLLPEDTFLPILTVTPPEKI